MSQVSARELIDLARVRHWSFAQVTLPEGAALLLLNAVQRQLLLRFGKHISPLISQSQQVATTFDGTLIGVDVDSDGGLGVPYYITGIEDGYAVMAGLDHVPYIDFTIAPIAGDPYGENGGNPGFPLPADLLLLISVNVEYTDGQAVPISIIAESARWEHPQGSDPAAFIAGSRIVPVRSDGTDGTDEWSDVATVQISYVSLQTVGALDAVLVFPAVLSEAISAKLAHQFALHSERCPASDKAMFAKDAERAELILLACAPDIMGEVTTSQVLYRG